MKSKKKSELDKVLVESELPVSRGILREVRNELRSDIASLSLKVDAKFEETKSMFNGVQGRIGGLEGRIAGLDGRIGGVESQIGGLNGRIDGLDSSLNSRIDGLNASLNGRIDSLDANLNGRIDSLEAGLNGRIDGLQGQIDGLQGQVIHLRSDMEKWNSNISRMVVMCEEQHSNNKALYEYVAGLFQRQERVETKVDGFEEWMRSIAKNAPKPGQS